MGEAGPLIGQGGVGASLASQLNLDIGINNYFVDSQDEVFYGEVRMQPLTFMDDCI